MKIFKNIFIYSVIGVGIGSLLTLGFSLGYGEFSPGVPEFINSFTSVNKAVLIQTLIYALLGIIQGFAVVIFENSDTKSLGRSFIQHYLVVMVPLILAGYYLKWFSDVKTLIIMLVFSSLIYLLIAVISYLITKNDIKKINSKLNNIK